MVLRIRVILNVEEDVLRDIEIDESSSFGSISFKSDKTLKSPNSSQNCLFKISSMFHCIIFPIIIKLTYLNYWLQLSMLVC